MLDPMLIQPRGRGGEIVISTAGFQSLGVPLAAMRATVANVAWPSANVLIAVPFTVPEPVTLTKLWWLNNALPAGNLDIGIFLEDGTRVVSSGSTAMAGAQTCQVVDITDTTIARGRYYVGLVCDTVSTNTFAVYNPAAGICQALGVVRDTAAAPPLSTSANPAAFVVTTHAYIPIMGAQGYRTVGP